MGRLQKAALQHPVLVCQNAQATASLSTLKGPGSRQQPDGQAAWRAFGEKYFNFSMRVEMRKLDGMTMTPNQEP